MSTRWILVRMTEQEADAVIAAVDERLAGGEGEHESTWGEDWKKRSIQAERGADRIRTAITHYWGSPVVPGGRK